MTKPRQWISKRPKASTPYSAGNVLVEIDHNVKFSKNRAWAQIEYVIDEGERYKLRSVDIFGNRIYSEEELRESLTLGAGDFFNARHLNKDVASLKGKYGDLGHLFATVNAVPRFLEEPGIADLVYQIDEELTPPVSPPLKGRD